MLPGSTYTPFPKGIAFGRSGVSEARLESHAVANSVIGYLQSLGLGIPDDAGEIIRRALNTANPVQRVTFSTNGSCELLSQSTIKASLWKLVGLLQFSVANATIKIQTDIKLVSQIQAHCTDISSELLFQQEMTEWTKANADFYRRMMYGEVREGEQAPPQPDAPTDPIPLGRKMTFGFNLIWYIDTEIDLGAISSVVRTIVQTDHFNVSTRCCFPE